MFLDGRKLPPLAGTVFLHFHLGPKTVPKAVYVVIQGEFIREIQLFAKQLSGGGWPSKIKKFNKLGVLVLSDSAF